MIGRFGISAALISLLFALGCSERVSQVTGRVTCGGKPVVGGILFSPAGDGDTNTGTSVPARLNEEGEFKLVLKAPGKYLLVITPRDVKFPVPPGEWDYPCDRSPIEKEVQAGANDFTIEMEPHPK